MQDLVECCIGLDIHRDTVVACLLTGAIDCKPTCEILSFGTFATDLNQLREWVLSTNCRYVAMESTGIYWQPIYDKLESCFSGDIHLLVVNARHMKNVPGKKTDMRDAEWIATLLRAGLLSGSFIPAKPFRELRHLTRYRKNLVRDITTQKNRIDKFLQSSGFRLSRFISDIFGASGRAIMRHLSRHGTIGKVELLQYLKTKTRNKLDDILISINGELSIHEQQLLAMMLVYLEDIELRKSEIEAAIIIEIQRHEQAFLIVTSIPGIDVIAATAIIAEIGTDMSRFKTAEHICSWAGLAPGNNESAGKRKNSRITKGNPYIKTMLCEVAWAIATHKDMYLAQWYWKLKQNRGSKRAIIALARKLLVMIYTMLKSGELYDENHFEQRRAQCESKRTARMVQELARLGYSIQSPA